MTGVPANRRPTNMVFQSYAIFPHLTVEQNVAYGLRRLRLGAPERDRRAEEALSQVDMAHLGARRSTELSGGQRQRLARARALHMRTTMLLVDEPHSALAKTISQPLQEERRHLQLHASIPITSVTHKQDKA